ncbi:MAG: phosphoribosylaminoimidazole carboxylase [Methylicorpusculum sp.]|uniref:phosphoribosylaminoimidazole carboxylase n=1 Tax=Methylicorpusculum sp. TaxID=2713644 RepID=UPI00271A1926|nr:phosphoribosylaminoimidazole carboxylase [Methylicorpusculum sp.]MDO8941001.1 phosphoribosylaminoimidazole carboxylase [Methylicorpusculum sp.]MDO9241927.1 phosphoribosylaminoimidazole carboxylase [Methylicorpusculum sp.]MDP2200894.1 phosphoribosylaminoimidazole carboxylase [Methylicorpusculum sp.]
MTNIFANIPSDIPEEIIENLVNNDIIRIERIISKGHITPYEQWYDQSHDEWILILQGQALLGYKEPDQAIKLVQGDHLLIPAHQKHRVEWTKPDELTIWLAIHWQAH